MDKQEIMRQIGVLLGQLLVEARGNQEAIALINEMLMKLGDITDSLS